MALFILQPDSGGNCCDCNGRLEPCDSCGEGGCECALLLPPFVAPYIDYATASGVITDPLLVADCIAHNEVSLSMISFSASFNGTTFTVSGAWSSSVSSFGYVWVSIAAKASATITVSANAGSSFDGVIYDCNGTTVETLGPAATPITSAALPAAGVYYLRLLPNSPPMGGGPFTACTITVTSSDTFTVNPVIAQWDDAGTTRKLWACPKMLLPPLTESTGEWYASQAVAQSEISTMTSNCVGYFTGATSMSAFSSVSSGTSVSISATTGVFNINSGFIYLSVNATAGSTISFLFSVSSGTALGQLVVYDDTGGGIYTSSVTTSSPITSSTLPYAGRYIIKLFISRTTGGVPIGTVYSGTVSGFDSVNLIQALYDVGLQCAARLNCV